MYIVVLVALSSIFSMISTATYIRGVLHDKAKPRVASWIVWAILTSIGGVAALVDKEYPAATLLLLEGLGLFTVVVLGLLHEQRDMRFGRLGVFCLAGAFLGIVLWIFTDSPSLAVVVAVSTDAIGSIPTFVHSLRQPQEEVWTSYALSCLAELCTITATTDIAVTALLYPVYNAISDTIYTVAAFRGRNGLIHPRLARRKPILASDSYDT